MLWGLPGLAEPARPGTGACGGNPGIIETAAPNPYGNADSTAA